MTHAVISISYAIVGLIYVFMFCVGRASGEKIAEQLDNYRDIIHAACALLLAFAYMTAALA